MMTPAEKQELDHWLQGRHLGVLGVRMDSVMRTDVPDEVREDAVAELNRLQRKLREDSAAQWSRIARGKAESPREKMIARNRGTAKEN